jgi:putative SOS response-associated peptidase YedK
MCGRFAQCADADTLARQFELETVPALTPRYNVAPTQPVLAVRIGDSGRRELTALRWGLVPSWSKGPDNRYSMINARAETVAEKPAYRAAFARRRCLIPADAFYEWRAGEHGKVPHAIRREDGAPFAMAGLWEHWTGADGSEIASCTIIVTDANALLALIHDRMPVILDAADYDAWLDPGAADKAALLALLKPASAEGWTAYRVSHAVNSPRNDSPTLLQPQSSLDASG